jgi:hypothetical protein
MRLFVNEGLSAPRKAVHYSVRRLTAYQTAGKHVRPAAAGAYRAAAPNRTRAKLLALLRQVELLEEEWLGDEQTGSTPLLLSLAVNADSLATWLLPALAPVLADSLSA